MKLFLELLRRTFKPSSLDRMDRSTYRIFTLNAALAVLSSFALGAWITQESLFSPSIANTEIPIALYFLGAMVGATWVTATQHRLYDVGLGDLHQISALVCLLLLIFLPDMQMPAELAIAAAVALGSWAFLIMVWIPLLREGQPWLNEHDPDYDPANFPELIPEEERIKDLCKLPGR